MTTPETEVLSSYIVVSVVLACNVIGYIIKHYIQKINKKYIPLIMMVCGVIINIIIAVAGGQPIDVVTIISGAVSGLASTGTYEAATGSLGLHKAFTALFAKKEEENEEPTEEESEEVSEEEATDSEGSEESEDSSEEVTDEEPKEE